MEVTVQPETVIETKEVEESVSDEEIVEVTTTIDELKKMTKKQLLSWSSDLGYDLVDNHVKAQLLEECIEILEELNWLISLSAG